MIEPTTAFSRRRSSSSMIEAIALYERRLSSGSIQQGRQRRSSGSTHEGQQQRRCSTQQAHPRESFAEYTVDQVDLTRLAIESLKQYMHDDFSDDDDCTMSSFEYSSDEENDDDDDDDDIEDDDEDIQLLAPPSALHDSFETPKKKKLCFGPVTVREYAVTVGASTGGKKHQYPLQLSWEHSRDVQMALPPSPPPKFSKAAAPFFELPKTTVRRLTMLERRKRIAEVQGIAEEEVDQLGIDNVMQHIKDAMSIVRIDL